MTGGGGGQQHAASAGRGPRPKEREEAGRPAGMLACIVHSGGENPNLPTN